MSSLGEGVDVSRPRDLVAESGVGDEIRAPEGADQAFERSLTDASDDDPAVRRAVGQTNTSFVDHHHLVVLLTRVWHARTHSSASQTSSTLLTSGGV